MCQPKPGLRCYGHMNAKVKSLGGRVKDSLNKIQSYNKEINSLAKDPAPLNKHSSKEDMKAWQSQREEKLKTLFKKRQTEHNRFFALKEEYDKSLSLLDGTPTGQKELEKKIETARQRGDVSKAIELENRAQKGRALRSLNRVRYQNYKMTQSSGMSIKQRRGDFLTMSDRGPDTEIVEDRDLLMV